MSEPLELYCLRDLPHGSHEPSTEILESMNRVLDGQAKINRVDGCTFTERHGRQYKISTDVEQFYIIRRYEDVIAA